MRTLVLGGDGHLGWPTALHLSSVGHDVAVLDNLARRRYDVELGTSSLVPIQSLPQRVAAWAEVSGRRIAAYEADLRDGERIQTVLEEFRPDAVVHFAEQRSAPYSMIDRDHAVYTQSNNVVGTLNLLFAIAAVDPSIHLVKLGTMGEYGTPNLDIEEGWLTITHNGRTDRVLYPKRPGSFYHLSKVHDSHNIEFATRAWGLAATDLNQGVVYGAETPLTALDPRLATRFDYDAVFGTVLNRFVVQAVIGTPLTVYGRGGQTRGMIDLRDTVECIRLAVERPAEPGEFRVFNQMTQSFSLDDLARLVVEAAPVPATVAHVDNPRVELEEHYYHVVHTRLEALGLKPHFMDADFVSSLYEVVTRYRDHVDPAVLAPSIDWRAAGRTVVRS
jgi:UDP-sulfoquinovose synthase